MQRVERRHSPWRVNVVRSQGVSRRAENRITGAFEPGRIQVFKGTLQTQAESPAESPHTKLHTVADLLLTVFGREKEEVMKYDPETGLIGVEGPVQNLSWLETDPVDLGGGVFFLTHKLLTRDGERLLEDIVSIRESAGGKSIQRFVIEPARFISHGTPLPEREYKNPYQLLRKISDQLHEGRLFVDKANRSHNAYPAFDTLAA